MFEYKAKRYRTLKINERGKNMKDEMHTIIVTRDETPIGCFFVEFWPKDAELEKIEGEWVSRNNVEKITRLAMSIFKQIFGYVPDAGSKETKTIDKARLDLIKRS